MRATVFLVVTLLAAAGALEEREICFSHKCFYRPDVPPMSWHEAETYCFDDGGKHLASITSSQDNDAVARLRGSDYAWIGFNDLEHEADFRWTDGTIPVYRNWGYNKYGGPAARNEPNDIDGNEDCVEMRYDNAWNDVVCEKQNAVICAGPGTPHGSERCTGSKCFYMPQSDATTWADAESTCIALGGHIASVADEQENNLVRELAANRSVDRVWLGLHADADRQFTWTDNSDATAFAKWAPFEPNNDRNSEDCGELWTSGGWDRLWNDVPCGLRFHFVCSAPTSFVDRVPADAGGGSFCLPIFPWC